MSLESVGDNYLFPEEVRLVEAMVRLSRFHFGVVASAASVVVHLIPAAQQAALHLKAFE